MRCGMTPAGVPAYKKKKCIWQEKDMLISVQKSYKYKLCHKMYKNT